MVCMYECVNRSVVSNSVNPWTTAHQAPLSMDLSRQEYWNEFPFLSPETLPNPGIKPCSPALQADSSHLSHQRSLRADSMTKQSCGCIRATVGACLGLEQKLCD